jgi:hypothetical protein
MGNADDLKVRAYSPFSDDKLQPNHIVNQEIDAVIQSLNDSKRDDKFLHLGNFYKVTLHEVSSIKDDTQLMGY